MTLKSMMDRKLLLMILAPLARRLGTAMAAYLVARGFPSDTIDQLLTALGVVLGLVFDLLLAHATERRKVLATAELLQEVENTTRADVIAEFAFGEGRSINRGVV